MHFAPAPAESGRALVLGEMLLGPLSDQKPNDHRPNLYVVCPGKQYPSDQERDVGFNVVLNSLPRSEEPVNWDVYWAIVLDPALDISFQSERDLLLAAQDAFEAGDELNFDEIPGAALLQEKLHISSISELASFRRPDGTLPRLLIVPSHLVIRAAAADPDTPPASRLSRAWSHFSRHKNSAEAQNAK
jgi:hypothetical protein